MRIAILTSDDAVWALPTWTRTVPALAERHDVAGIVLVPERLGRHTGLAVPLWYLRTFGLAATVLLGLHAVLTRLRQRGSWERLAAAHELDLAHSPSANDPAVAAWLREREVDVVFAMVGEILRAETLSTPRLGMINKHASVLPSARGVFPFFWARLEGLPLGLTFHVMDEGVDTGPLLVQERCPENDASRSMLGFYAETYRRYAELAPLAAERLAAGEYLDAPADVAPSHFGFPTRADARRFRRAGHRVARVADLRRVPA